MKQLVELVVVATIFAATVFVAAPAQAQTTVNIHMNNLGGMFSAPELPIFIAGADTPVCVIKEEGHCSFKTAPGQRVNVQIGSRLSLRNTYTTSAQLDFVDGATQNYAMVIPSAKTKTQVMGGQFGLIGVFIGHAVAVGVESVEKGPVNLLGIPNAYYDLIEVK